MRLANVLVLADSAFPAGTFGHSFGLETAIVEGRVASAEGMRAWIYSYALHALATLDAAALVLALRDGVDAKALDELVSASLVAAEVRAANAQLARSTLDAYEAMGLSSVAIEAYRASLCADGGHGVHALAIGLGYAAAGVAWPDALRAYFSSTFAALVSVGTRAIPLGQRAAARLLWELRPLVEEAASKAERVNSVDDLCAQAFGCEIDAMRHAELDGRMFVS